MILNEREEDEVSPEDLDLTTVVSQIQQTLRPSESLRLELLNLSKEILLSRAAMKWETTTRHEEVTVDQIIESARSMFNFVMEEKQCR